MWLLQIPIRFENPFLLLFQQRQHLNFPEFLQCIHQNPYKYQQRTETNSDDIATIKIRYKNIGETESREEEFVVNDDTMNKTTLNAQLANEVYDIAEILRETKKGNYDKARINLLALTNNI